MASPRGKRARNEESFRGDTQGEEEYDPSMTEEVEEPIHYKVERNHTVSMIDPSEWNLDDAQEPQALPDGTECKARIISVRKDTDKNGNPYWMPSLEVCDEPTAKDFTHFLGVPSRDMNPKQMQRASWNMKVFMECFELDYTEAFDPSEDWPGSEGWVILGHRQDDQYGEQNFIKKFIRAQ